MVDTLETPEPRSRRDRPAKPPLSRAAIVDAALVLVRQEGLDAVSLRKVAEQLDTGPASLYVYVENRDDLLGRMLDRVLTEVPLSTVNPGRWQQQIVELFTDTLAALERYPGIAQAALGSIPTWPGALAITENALALMRAGAIEDQAAAWACDALLLFTTATAVEHAIESRRAPTTTQHKSPETDYGAAARELFASLPVETYPNLARMATTMTQGDDEQRFRFGLSALINGARGDRRK